MVFIMDHFCPDRGYIFCPLCLVRLCLGDDDLHERQEIRYFSNGCYVRNDGMVS